MIDIEQTILGACFYPEAVNDIVAQFDIEDFQPENHKSIFKAVCHLVGKGVCPDPVTLAAEDTNLSLGYLSKLFEDTPSVANINYHLKKFNEYAEKNRYVNMAYRIGFMRDATVDELRMEVDSVFNYKQASGAEHASKALKRSLAIMEDAYKNKGKITGIPTGIYRMDEELSGLHKTDMILIAARPSIGKTALALQIAEHACLDRNVPTLFISLEMSSEQLMSRLVLSRSKVCVSKARNGLFEEYEWPKMMRSAGHVNESQLYVDDCTGVTIDTICAKAKAAKMRHDIGLLVIDYLGLVAGKGTEYEKITAASQKVKSLAKQLNIPIVCLHQLNRSNLTNRPTMNELRSSGQLEQDADVIILLHREKQAPVEDCEIIIEKNRHGKTGIVPQRWNGPINRIEERENSDIPDSGDLPREWVK